MAVPIADLNIRITANAAQFNTSITQVTAKLGSLTQTALGTAAGFLGLQSGVAVFDKLRDAIAFAISTVADSEQAVTGFRVMLGSAKDARDMMAEIRDLARVSPLVVAGLVDASRTMLQFGVAGESVIPILKVLGDATGGDNERFQRMALVFGQMSAAGRLMGQDLLQMINSGFNPLQTISQKTGESMIDLKKRMEEGGISAQEVTLAFIDATSAGGRFSGLMAEQSQTFAGQWATLKDDVQLLALSIGQDLLPAAKEAIYVFKELVTQIGQAAEFTKAFWHEIDNTQGPLKWLIGTRTRDKEFQVHRVLPKVDRRDVEELRKRVFDDFSSGLSKSELEWQSWADKLRESLKDSSVVMLEEWAKIDAGFKAGLLTAEEYGMAIERLIGKFDKASDSKRELDRIDTQGVGAATRFTTEGFSAVRAGNSALTQLTRSVANATQQTADATRGILDFLRGQQASIVAVGVR